LSSDERKDATAALRITSVIRTVDEISAIMQARPSERFGKGDVVRSRGVHTARIRGHTMWSLNSGLREDCPLEDHIKWLVSFASNHREAIAGLRTDCELDIFCSFTSYNGQGSVALDHGTMSELGSLGIDVIVDLYLSDGG
jgi:hypothetical protein